MPSNRNPLKKLCRVELQLLSFNCAVVNDLPHADLYNKRNRYLSRCDQNIFCLYYHVWSRGGGGVLVGGLGESSVRNDNNYDSKEFCAVSIKAICWLNNIEP